MIRYVFAFFVFWMIGTLPARSQDTSIQPGDVAWFARAGHRIDAGGPDWSFLHDQLKSVRVVQIGGSRSLPPEYAAPAIALIRYLHEVEGFTVLILEAGLAESGVAWLQADSLGVEDRMRLTARRVCAREEMRSLFDYVASRRHTARPLILLGNDDMPSSRAFGDYLRWWASTTEFPDADSLLTAETLWREVWVDHLDDPEYLNRTFAAARYYRQALAFAASRPTLPPGPGGFRTDCWFTRALEVRLEAIAPGRFVSRETIESYRDRLMGENVLWALRQFSPEEKIIVWAPNGHVTEAPGGTSGRFVRAGGLVARALGDSVYTIGFFTGGGTQDHFHTSNLPAPPPGSLEAHLSASDGDLFFINLDPDAPAWTRQVTPAALEPWAILPIVPDEHYDAFLFVRSISEGKPLSAR